MSKIDRAADRNTVYVQCGAEIVIARMLGTTERPGFAIKICSDSSTKYSTLASCAEPVPQENCSFDNGTIENERCETAVVTRAALALQDATAAVEPSFDLSACKPQFSAAAGANCPATQGWPG